MFCVCMSPQLKCMQQLLKEHQKIAEYRYFPLNKYERAETDLVFSDPFFKHAYEDIVTTAGTKEVP